MQVSAVDIERAVRAAVPHVRFGVRQPGDSILVEFLHVFSLTR